MLSIIRPEVLARALWSCGSCYFYDGKQVIGLTWLYKQLRTDTAGHDVDYEIIHIVKLLRCHSQMFTGWLTSIGKWLKMNQLVECGLFKQMDFIYFLIPWWLCIDVMSPKSSTNRKWRFVSTAGMSMSAENAKMLAHSLQQLLAEQVWTFSHSLQGQRLGLTKWWLMVYKTWQPVTIAWMQIDLCLLFPPGTVLAGREQSLHCQCWSGHWERWASAAKRRVEHVLKWLFLKLFFRFAFASAFPENWVGCKSSGRNQLKHLIECVVSFSSLYFLPTYVWYCSGIQQAALNGVDGKRAFPSQLYL